MWQGLHQRVHYDMQRIYAWHQRTISIQMLFVERQVHKPCNWNRLWFVRCIIKDIPISWSLSLYSSLACKWYLSIRSNMQRKNRQDNLSGNLNWKHKMRVERLRYHKQRKRCYQQDRWYVQILECWRMPFRMHQKCRMRFLRFGERWMPLGQSWVYRVSQCRLRFVYCSSKDKSNKDSINMHTFLWCE